MRVGRDADFSLAMTTLVWPVSSAVTSEINELMAVTGTCPFGAPASFIFNNSGSIVRVAVRSGSES